MPQIVAFDKDWERILEENSHRLPADFYQPTSVKTDMRGGNAIRMIAYYCSILNTDPSYIDVFYLNKDHIYAGAPHGPHTDHDYEEFRLVFGVCVAAITSFLMHFNIEISLAMKEGEKRWHFDSTRKFRYWGSRPEFEKDGWLAVGGDAYRLFNPRFMKWVTPFNFMYVSWQEFEGIVGEVLAKWSKGKADECLREWSEYSAGLYSTMKLRGDCLLQPWMKSRMFLWKEWKGVDDVVFGMARKKAARDHIEKYAKKDPPYDYLQTSFEGFKMDHTYTGVDYKHFVNRHQDTVNLVDIFPGSPEDFVYPLPTSEKEWLAMRAKEQPGGKGKRKAPAETSGSSKKHSSGRGASLSGGDASWEAGGGALTVPMGRGGGSKGRGGGTRSPVGRQQPEDDDDDDD